MHNLFYKLTDRHTFILGKCYKYNAMTNKLNHRMMRKIIFCSTFDVKDILSVSI